MIKILVVEDREDFMNAAKTFFKEHSDVETTFASSYEEAENILGKNNFDIVLSDVFMPSVAKKRHEILSSISSLTPKEIKETAGSYDNFLESVATNNEDLTESPVGILLCQLAKQKGTAVVMAVTSVHHHSKKFEAVYRYLISRGDGILQQDGGEGYISKEELEEDPKRYAGAFKENPEFWESALENAQYYLDDEEI